MSGGQSGKLDLRGDNSPLLARETCAPGADGSRPYLVKFPGEALVDMRADQLGHGKGEVVVFGLAALGAPLGQQVLFDDVGKQFLVGAVGDAQDIERPLRRQSSARPKTSAGTVTCGPGIWIV